MAPTSIPPPPPCSFGMSEVRSEPPAAPPKAPAMVLPAGPQIYVFHRRADPVAADRARQMSWIMRFMIVPDMVSLPLGRKTTRKYSRKLLNTIARFRNVASHQANSRETSAS